MSETIGHYRIVEELGRGGMGVVYKAHEESLNRFVALKVLGEHLAEDETFVTRFKREAQAAAGIEHPNLVQIYFIGEDRGRHYFAMEFVKGRSVQSLIRDRGRMPVAEAVAIARQAASGLAAAHDQGVLHRDIKPANLMVTDDGRVKVADFGLALRVEESTRLTATGSFLGTPAYVPPEICEGEQPDQRADIYALGLTLYEMLTGHVPFQSDSPMALLRQIVQVEPPRCSELNPAVPPELDEVLARMMAKQRDARFSSCHEVMAALEPFAHGQRQIATTPISPPPPPVPAARGRATANTGAAAVVATAPVANNDATVRLADETGPPTPPPAAARAAVKAEKRGPSPGLVLLAVVVSVLVVAALGAAALLVWRMGTAAVRSGHDEVAAAVTTDFADAADVQREEPTDGAAVAAEPASGTAAAAMPPAAGGTEATAWGRERGGAPPAEELPGGGGGGSAARTPPPAQVAEGGRGGTTVPGSAAVVSAEGSQRLAGGERPTPAPAPGSATRAAAAPSTAAAPPRLPPLPARPRVAVVGTGEPILAVAAEEMLEDELANRGLDVVSEDGSLRVNDLLRTPGGFALSDLTRELDAAGIHVLVLAETDFVGERELYYLGRYDRALTSRLRVNAYLTRDDLGVGSGWSDELEYTRLKARPELDKVLLPMLPDFVAGIEAGWSEARATR